MSDESRHCPDHEALEVDAQLGELGDALDRELAGKRHARSTQTARELDAGFVTDVHLR